MYKLKNFTYVYYTKHHNLILAFLRYNLSSYISLLLLFLFLKINMHLYLQFCSKSLIINSILFYC